MFLFIYNHKITGIPDSQLIEIRFLQRNPLRHKTLMHSLTVALKDTGRLYLRRNIQEDLQVIRVRQGRMKAVAAR